MLNNTETDLPKGIMKTVFIGYLLPYDHMIGGDLDAAIANQSKGADLRNELVRSFARFLRY